ncbi:MAG TPA: hypothetical protein VGO57_14645 [Verrucomicrobiae bacterium]|jgi:hypothetical protein
MFKQERLANLTGADKKEILRMTFAGRLQNETNGCRHISMDFQDGLTKNKRTMP